ncbi:hypothetical protein AaE_015278, partial [Aphanomyces astaci]
YDRIQKQERLHYAVSGLLIVAAAIAVCVVHHVGPVDKTDARWLLL